jgi:hypothetical protein
VDVDDRVEGGNDGDGLEVEGRVPLSEPVCGTAAEFRLIPLLDSCGRHSLEPSVRSFKPDQSPKVETEGGRLEREGTRRGEGASVGWLNGRVGWWRITVSADGRLGRVKRERASERLAQCVLCKALWRCRVPSTGAERSGTVGRGKGEECACIERGRVTEWAMCEWAIDLVNGGGRMERE